MAGNADYSLQAARKNETSAMNYRIRIQRKIRYHELKRCKVAFMFKQATCDGRHRLYQNPHKVH